MNPASFSTADSPSNDKLIAGQYPRVTKEITVLTGENLVRGTVVGAVTVGAAVAAAVAGNTGNGVFGAVTTPGAAKPGVYKVTFIEPAANLGAFVVEDPDGVIEGHGTVGSAYAGSIAFTIADGAADFVAGDQFTVTVAAGTGKYKKAVAAAVDGSQRPLGILVEDVDATAADKKGSIYATGEFNKAALTFGAGHTAVTVAADLEAKNIYLRDVVAA